MKRALLLTALSAAACVHRVPPPFPTETAHLHITLHVPRSGPIGVRLQMDGQHWPGPAQAAFTALPDSHLNQLSPPPQLDLPTGSSLDVSYEVQIPNVESTPEGPALTGSFDTPTGRHLSLNGLIPVMQQRDNADRIAPVLPALIEVESDLPLTASLQGNDGVYWATTQNQLYHGLILAGRAAEVTGSDNLRIVSTDFDAAALERLAALERRAAVLLEKSHGPRETLPLVVVHREPKTRPNVFLEGINNGTADIVIFSKDIPDGRATSLTGNVLLHELIHSYQPPDHALPHWITEGFTEYFAHRLGLALDGFPDDTLYVGLEGLWSAFVETTPGRRASESQLGDYYGGAVLAFCIDTRLRKDGSSLEAILAATRRRAKGAVSNALWEQEIAVASAPAGALVLNAKTQPIDPVDSCLKEAGLKRLAMRPAMADSYLARAFGMRAVDLEPRHYDVLVMQVDGKGPLVSGDTLVSVGGKRICGMGELLEELRDAVTLKQDSVTVELSRNGALEKLVVPLPTPYPAELAPTPRRVWKKP